MERIGILLKYLNKENGFITVDELAENMGVTSRTIRSDLNKIQEILNKNGIKIIKKRNEGIALSKKNMDESVIMSLLQNLNDSKDFYTIQERENIIINQLLISEIPTPIKKFEEMTISSKSSVKKNILSAEKYLSKWNIKVLKKPKTGLSIICKEYDYRQAVVDRLVEYTGKNDYSYLCYRLINNEGFENTIEYCDFINHFIRNVNTMRVSNFIKKYEADNRLHFTDKSFITIIFYICVTETRIKEGYGLKEENQALKYFFNTGIIEKSIQQRIKETGILLNILKSEYEIQHLLAYLLSQKLSTNSNYTQADCRLEVDKFNRDSKEVVEEFIKIVQSILNVNLTDDKVLFDNLLIHIRPTIYRMLFGIKMENPLTDDIKLKYPAIFWACKEASVVLEKKTNKCVDDDEISYLSMHIGASIEKKKENRDKDCYRVLAVCPEGNGTSSILYYRLLSSFPNIQIDGMCSVTELNQYNKSGIDFIVSTVPIYKKDQRNVINVNPLLHEKDVENISKIMKRIDMHKDGGVSFVIEDIMSIVSNYAAINSYADLKNNLIKYFDKEKTQMDYGQVSLTSFLTEELVEVQAEAKDWEEAFAICGELLVKKDYIEKRYIDAMIEAAKLYGGYMMIGNGVALPHAKVTDGSYKTAFSFITLKNPVIFPDNGKELEIKMVVCLAADDNYNHVSAMGKLVEIISEEEEVNALTKYSQKEDFINHMKYKIDEFK